MIDLSIPNEWQHRCPETGLVLPWYTKSFLDELVTWDFTGKSIFEFGCGASTLWYASKVPVVYGVENNSEFREAVLKELKKGSHEIDFYIGYDLEQPFEMFGTDHHPMFDIIAIDCEPVKYRQQFAKRALDHLKPGGILIYDNWMQPSVEIQCEGIQNLLLGMPHKVYRQEGHPDWQTLVVTKP